MCRKPLHHLRDVISLKEWLIDFVTLHWSYPMFVVTTGLCARPIIFVRLCLIGFALTIFAGCCKPLLIIAPSQRYLCKSFFGCLTPYSGVFWSAFSHFFLQNFGLPPRAMESAWHNIRTATSVRDAFRNCRYSLLFKPPNLLATLVARTAILTHTASSDFYIRAEHESLPSHASDMLIVWMRNSQCKDFHFARFTALLAAPARVRLFLALIKSLSHFNQHLQLFVSIILATLNNYFAE